MVGANDRSNDGLDGCTAVRPSDQLVTVAERSFGTYMAPHNRLVAPVASRGAAAAQIRRYARLYWAVCYAAVLALASNVCSATIVEPRGLDKLVREAEYIGSVWIEQSTSLSDDPTLKYPACGASYTAQTVDVVKGAGGRLKFYASEDLVVGREYLVLLAQGMRSTTAITSTTSLRGTPSGMEAKQKYMADCGRRHPGLWSMMEAAAPLLDRRLKIVSQGHPGDRWVWQPYFLRDIESIEQLNEHTLSMVLLSTTPTTPYPAGTYLSWQGVRDALRGAVMRATSGKALERSRAK
jgi:hypothetical protein